MHPLLSTHNVNKASLHVTSHLTLHIPTMAEAQKDTNFDDRFKQAEQPCYFHHVISPDTATLRVEVLGPNLVNEFTHSQAAQHFSHSHIEDGLRRKTTGFLALFVPAAEQRTVLAWAESGHGHNPRGDFLDAKPAILSNKLWTARAIRLAGEMDINMGHPYDGLTRGGKVGLFRASHVEVKLAVHAVYVLLKMCGIPTAHVTRRHLQLLRGRTWGGAPPRFEVYFSKKNCHACAQYVGRLEELTGAEIKLCWRERLVKIEYEKTRMGALQTAPISVDGEEEEEEEVQALTDSDMQDMSETLGSWIDGLAYCIGQVGEWARVRDAVVALARISRRKAAHGRATRRYTTPVERNWLATPPPSNTRRQRDAALIESAGNEGTGLGCRSPRPYSFTGS
jgi:hypothetical protein